MRLPHVLASPQLPAQLRHRAAQRIRVMISLLLPQMSVADLLGSHEPQCPLASRFAISELLEDASDLSDRRL